MRFALDEVAAAVGGARTGPDGDVVGVSIDSRTLPVGALFVPIVGERDGHDFIAAARRAGAAAHLTAKPMGHPDEIAVDDTAAALTMLGRHARTRLPDAVVGVTGSAGKTSTKDLLAAVLRRRGPVAASEKSFNNELGVPVTLCNAPDAPVAAVVEMGARGIGHIARLCLVARPTVGIVTLVGAAHLELFGTIDDVARGKGELIEALPPQGLAVLNADDDRVLAMSARTSARVLSFGVGGGAEVRAEAVEIGDDLRPRFRMRTPWGDAPVVLGARGRHQVGNALAAAAAALGLGSSLEDVVGGLADACLSPWRMELVRTETGALVLNDAYNANPTSMAAALRSLAELPARRRIAVLGTMAELGDSSHDAHAEIGELARSLGIDVVLAVGEPAFGVAVVDTTAAVRPALGRLVEGDAVLVKGSRVAGLEVLAAELVADAGGAAGARDGVMLDDREGHGDAW